MNLGVRIDGDEAVRRGLARLSDDVGVSGLTRMMHEVTARMQRFATINVEVDTGRTRNSIFSEVSANNSAVRGMVASDVRYAPWVRDAGHEKQFMTYARERELPRVVSRMGGQIVERVGEAF